MGIRKKGRTRFKFVEREFVWWVDSEIILRIASDDKRFVVGYLLIGDSRLLAVHGPDFPGVDDNQRPLHLCIEPLEGAFDMGRMVDHILSVCFITRKFQQYLGELPNYGTRL